MKRVRVLCCVSTLVMPLLASAEVTDFSLRMDDPASWALKHQEKPGEQAPSRWSAKGVQKSIDENAQQQQNNDVWQRRNEQKRAERNPLCSERNRDRINRDYHSRNASRHRKTFAEICPDGGNALSFSLPASPP